MAHGTPDWWGNVPSETVHGGVDTGELAARLGSIVTFDRRGNIVWMDAFENGLGPWEWSGSGANNAVNLGTEITMHGSLAAYLHPGEEEAGEALIRHNLPFPVLGGIGIEVSFVPQEHMWDFDVILFLWDGARRYDYQARYSHVAGNVYVCTGLEEYTPVGAPGVQGEGWHSHCIMKMVANCVTHKFERVLFNNHVYDASAHTVYSVADTDTKPVMVAYVSAFNTGVHLFDVPVDYVIVTQNEPL